MSAPRRVLLVEDDRAIRDSLVDAMRDDGYEVNAARDGLDALEQLRTAAALPQVIVLDLMMPRMSGPELAAELDKVRDWARIPVLVISADTRAEAKAEAMRADAWLRKPLRLNELFDALEKLMLVPARSNHQAPADV
ncbi:MAG: response regulator [Archangiaceae bacterium]|nr:response regulator [Archangiaceae bacterium]